MNFPLGSVIRYNGELGVITFTSKTLTEAFMSSNEVTHDVAKMVPEGAVRDISHLLSNAINRIIYPTHPTTGSDPEIFAFDDKGDVMPAWDWLPNKDKARTLLTGGTSGAQVKAYWDGAQAEITTDRGQSCIAWLVDDIQRGLLEVYTKLREANPNAILKCEDVVKVPDIYMQSASDNAIALGCAPSDNAYGIEPIDIGHPRRHNLRYSGCHLHFRAAFDENTKTIKEQSEDWYPHGIIVMMDKVLGVCLTALGRDLENPLRRKAYGRPGEYRMTAPETLGIEYRTPGAFLLSSPNIFNFACDVGRAAYRLGLIYDGREFFLPDVKDIILNCDADAAVKVIHEHRGFFQQLFKTCFGETEQTMRILEKGLKSQNLVGDVAKNWKLDNPRTYSPHSDGGRGYWMNIVNI